MKRWTLRTVSCLVLGCVTTVAVAWGCVLIASNTSANSAGLPIEASSWPLGPVELNAIATHTVLPDGGVQREIAFSSRVFSGVYSCRGLRHQVWPPLEMSRGHLDSGHLDIDQPLPPPDPPPTIRLHVRVGWPFHAMKYGLQWENPSWAAASNTPFNAKLGGRLFGGAHPETLPVSVRPIEFAVSTLFYGVIWFGIFFAFASAQRALRKHRGRCPKCNYDLRSELDKGCSECGWNRPESTA